VKRRKKRRRGAIYKRVVRPSSIYQRSMSASSSSKEGSAPLLSSSNQKEVEQVTATHHRLMVRQMDDYLFLSTARVEGSTFVKKMHQRHPSYCINVNRSKTIVSEEGLLHIDDHGDDNDDHDNDDGNNAKEFKKKTSRFLPWNGLLIDTYTLEVRGDYSRYLSFDLRYTLTVEASRQPGEALLQATNRFVISKCHLILLDGNINTKRTVVLNVYQMCAFAAIKMIVYAKAAKMALKPSLAKKIATSAVQHLMQRIKTVFEPRIRGQLGLDEERRPFLPLATYESLPKGSLCSMTRDELQFCGACAFHNVLVSRKIKFPEATKELAKWKSDIVRRLDDAKGLKLSIRAAIHASRLILNMCK